MNSFYLIVEQAPPFEAGSSISLQQTNMIIGRQRDDWTPQIALTNAFVSRKHACIYMEENQLFIMDLASKHGTEVNGVRLDPHVPVVLKASDKITLANAMVSFYLSTNLDETMDLTPLLSVAHRVSLTLEPIKQMVYVDDQTYPFSAKEFQFLEMLLHQQEQFVSQDDIKKRVWPERLLEDEEVPSVGSEEMASLLYRIRKQLKDYITIESIRGKGYILHVNEKVEYTQR
ncbi:FHA domain-containing protein [Bacillus sp. CGMCC 1.16541]|uniref:FHA domain-containing protein n=1 Tax=Bacillus sp. CGMCC 1.16541 TaxID=2185143 RepID=UPI000D730089|nr:FHA domain-containing protein [Bacillus sp. CGMCC 1.16541]